MNELTSTPNSTFSWKDTLATGLTQLDSKTLLQLNGMLCITTLLCVSLIYFSGGQITITKNGLSIMPPESS